MKPEAEVRIKYGVWGVVVGAVIAMIIGFAVGGWTTSGTTKTMTEEAVLASQAAICVAQFMAQPKHEEKLKELEKIDSWKRAEFIKKEGWRWPGNRRSYFPSRIRADLPTSITGRYHEDVRIRPACFLDNRVFGRRTGAARGAGW